MEAPEAALVVPSLGARPCEVALNSACVRSGVPPERALWLAINQPATNLREFEMLTQELLGDGWREGSGSVVSSLFAAEGSGPAWR